MMDVRWRELITAFFMAVILWYGLSGSEKIESQVEVRVDYRGLPAGLVVREGLVSKINVRVRAPAGMLGSLSSKEYAFFMDLSDTRKGENVLPFTSASLPFRGGVEVLEISPSRIVLDVDEVETKMVPLEASLQGNLPLDYIAQATLTPHEVQLTGPSTLVQNIHKVVVPIAIESPVIPGETDSTKILLLPEGVDAQPSKVSLSLQLGIKRVQVAVTRAVRVDVPAKFGRFIRPDKVEIVLNIPESLAGKAATNSDIKASVELQNPELGSYPLPVQVALPEGAELVSIQPPSVTVTVEQKAATESRKQHERTGSR